MINYAIESDTHTLYLKANSVSSKITRICILTPLRNRQFRDHVCEKAKLPLESDTPSEKTYAHINTMQTVAAV